MDKNEKTHKIWHQFSEWLIKKFGEDLYSDWIVHDVKLDNGKTKRFKYRNFNEYELSRRLVGHDVIEKVESYVKRYCKDIKIVRCDDSVYSGSTLLLIPHPKHGITIMFIPQCTSIQNQFFLYSGHYNMLSKALKDLEWVYDNEKIIEKEKEK